MSTYDLGGPMSIDATDVLEQALEWHGQGKAVALATVIKTWGSAPRPVGSQLAVEQGGAFVGSVSGGCIEAAVVQAALEVMTSRVPRRLDFGVSNDEAWEVGLACGGRIEIYLEALEQGTSA
jgi:xanthine/CO dehydrogenase XdhC/CoxF family maturation factor